MLKMFKGSDSSELLVQALVVDATCNDLKPKVIVVSIQEPSADCVVGSTASMNKF